MTNRFGRSLAGGRLAVLVALGAAATSGCARSQPSAGGPAGDPPVLQSSASIVPADGVSAVSLSVSGGTGYPMTVWTSLGVLSTGDGQSGRSVQLRVPGTSLALRSACDATTVAGCWGIARLVATDPASLAGFTSVSLTCPGATCQPGGTGSVSGSSGASGSGTGGSGASGYAISGTVSGAAGAGVTVRLSGGASTTVVAGAGGGFLFGNLASGSYLVAPAASPGLFFLPPSASVTLGSADVSGVLFTAYPGAAPACTVQIAGDATSGVGTSTYACDTYQPPSNVAVLDSAANAWTLSFQFDTATMRDLGGSVSLTGVPGATTYTAFNVAGPLCWVGQSVPGGGYDESWTATSFTLTLSYVGAGVTTDTPGASAGSFLLDYPVHGTFHAGCQPAPTQANLGNVTMDVSF